MQALDLQDEIQANNYDGRCRSWETETESPFRRIRDEPEKWIRFKTVANPSPSEWDALFKSDSYPLLGVQVSTTNRSIYFIHNGQSSVDEFDGTKTVRRWRRCDHRWDFSLIPFVSDSKPTLQINWYRYCAQEVQPHMNKAKSYFSGNLFIPVDELELAGKLRWISVRTLRQRKTSVDALSLQDLEKIDPGSPLARFVVLNFCAGSNDCAAFSKVRLSLETIFGKHHTPSAFGLGRPHTLILRSPNDDLLKVLFSDKGKSVPGIARLVVEKTNDLTTTVEALQDAAFLEELVLPRGDVHVSCPWKMSEAIAQLKCDRASPKESYEEAPPKLLEKIRAAKVEKVEPLPNVASIPMSTPMYLPCGFGSAWPMQLEHQDKIGMLKRVLEDAGVVPNKSSSRKRNREEVKNAPASAGEMKPLPSEEAGALARHFVKHYSTSPEEDQDSLWPSSFDAFYSGHIEPQGQSDAEVRRACWLLGELWGIASYLQIEELQKFCRAAWVVMTT